MNNKSTKSREERRMLNHLRLGQIAFALIIVSILLVITCCFTSCEGEVYRVTENINKEADNFNISRRLSVINMRTDKPIFTLVGNFSLQNEGNNELSVIVETDRNQYKKHYIYLNDWTMYFVEDISGANVSPYHYEINFLPEMILPYTFTGDSNTAGADTEVVTDFE